MTSSKCLQGPEQQNNSYFSQNPQSCLPQSEIKLIFLGIEQRISSKEHSTIKSQLTLLKSFFTSLQSQIYQIQASTQTSELKYLTLINKISKNQQFLKSSSTQAQIILNTQNLTKKYLQLWKKRIQISEKIQLDKFLHSRIFQALNENRHNVGHIIFKWMTVCMYNEAESSYYWPVFRQEILEKQKRQNDLLERLGRANSSKATVYQIQLTRKLLGKMDSIKSLKEFDYCYQEIHKLHKVVEIYLACYELYVKTQDNQKKIREQREIEEKIIQETDLLTDKMLAQRFKLDGFRDLLKGLSEIKHKIQKKIDLYQENSKKMENPTIEKSEIALESQKKHMKEAHQDGAREIYSKSAKYLHVDSESESSSCVDPYH